VGAVLLCQDWPLPLLGTISRTKSRSYSGTTTTRSITSTNTRSRSMLIVIINDIVLDSLHVNVLRARST
jgi:hypothetical protein